MDDTFKFIDLFCGMGGFHSAAVKSGGVCVLACDINDKVRKVYAANYGMEPYGDIRKIKSIPQCDLLCAGFPCVTFSTIGKRQGTCDPRGKLFFEIMRLVKTNPPKIMLFENVKGLLSDEGGKTWSVFKAELESNGYTVTHAVLDAANFGVPQHRERVYIVCTLRDFSFNFAKLLKTRKRKVFKDIMSPITAHDQLMSLKVKRFDGHIGEQKQLKSGVILRAQKNNYINNKLYSSDGIVGTLCSGCIPIVYDERLEIPRTMTIPEMLQCQGFGKRFLVPDGITKTDMQHMTGNAVCVNVVAAIVKDIRRQGLL